MAPPDSSSIMSSTRPHIMIPSHDKIYFISEILSMGFAAQEGQNTIWTKDNVKLIVTNTRVTVMDAELNEQVYDYSVEQQDMLFRNLQLDKLI